MNPDLVIYGTQLTFRIPELGAFTFDFAILKEPFVKDFIALDVNGTIFNEADPVPLVVPQISIPNRDVDGKAF